ncbi:MAG: hypothetical protein QW728_06345 [Thermoplasmata archaeon]
MEYMLLLLSVVISFLCVIYSTPKFIAFLTAAGITGIDIQKKKKPVVPEMGGPAAATGFLMSIFIYIWFEVFWLKEDGEIGLILSGTVAILIALLVGMFDDLSTLTKKAKKDTFGNMKRLGLAQWQKPLLTLPAAVPLMAILAKRSVINLPFDGEINVGLLYPLVLIPIGIVGASNATNMLAGLNGLEAGLGFITLFFMGIYGIINNAVAGTVIAFSFAFALLGFLVYNWYPAKIFPGDSLTYTIGATIAVVAIVGRMEVFGACMFFLWFVELFLKARMKFRAESSGKIQSDGTLKAPYTGIHSLTHIPMKLGRMKEWEVVLAILNTQLALSIILIILFVWLG